MRRTGLRHRVWRKVSSLLADAQQTGVNVGQAHLAGGSRRILVSGAGGLLGRHVVQERRAAGDTVVALTRGSAGVAGTLRWDPASGMLDPRTVSGFDAVIHLAGEPVAGWWTVEKKRRIRESRVNGTALLAKALAAAEQPPKVLLCASGINFYGDQGEAVVDEDWPVGRGFLAQVSADWEAACDPLQAIARVVHLRIAMVLARDGGTLPLMLPPFRLGLGGTVGDGTNYLSWISINDVVRATAFALNCEALEGPVNLVSPQAVTGRAFTAALAYAVRRRAVVTVPASLARWVMGELANETVLNSLRAVPKRLAEAGFQFNEETVAKALAACGLR